MSQPNMQPGVEMRVVVCRRPRSPCSVFCSFLCCCLSCGAAGAGLSGLPRHAAIPWGEVQIRAPQCLQEQGEQGRIDALGLNGRTSGRALNKHLTVIQIPPSLYEIKRTFITACGSPLSPILLSHPNRLLGGRRGSNLYLFAAEKHICLSALDIFFPLSGE